MLNAHLFGRCKSIHLFFLCSAVFSNRRQARILYWVVIGRYMSCRANGIVIQTHILHKSTRNPIVKRALKEIRGLFMLICVRMRLNSGCWRAADGTDPPHAADLSPAIFGRDRAWELARNLCQKPLANAQ